MGPRACEPLGVPRTLSTLLWPCVCATAAGALWSTAGSGPDAATPSPIAAPLSRSAAPPRDTADARGALASTTPVDAPSLGAQSARRAASDAQTPPRGPRWKTDAERLAVGAADLARAADWPATEADLAELAGWLAARPDVEAALSDRDPEATWRFNSTAAAWHQDLITLVGLSAAKRIAGSVELVLIDGESREPVRVGLEGRFVAVPLRSSRD